MIGPVHLRARGLALGPRRVLTEPAASLLLTKRVESISLFEQIYLDKSILNQSKVSLFFLLQEREVGCSTQHNNLLNRTIKLKLIKLGNNCHLLCQFL